MADSGSRDSARAAAHQLSTWSLPPGPSCTTAEHDNGNIPNAGDAVVAADDALHRQRAVGGPGRIEQGGLVVPQQQVVAGGAGFVGAERGTGENHVVGGLGGQAGQADSGAGEFVDLVGVAGGVRRRGEAEFAVDDDPDGSGATLAAGDVLDGEVAGRRRQAGRQPDGRVGGGGSSAARGLHQGLGEFFSGDAVVGWYWQPGHPVPPIVMPSMRTVGKPTPTGTL